MPSSDILHLPISFHGFGFASISHFNDACVISSVLQDLNHHVPLFHKMAQITISNWQCLISHCIYPFSSCGLLHSFHLSCLSILIQFTLAHQVMHSLKLLIFPSDQSSIMNGEISLVHLAQLTPDPPHITSLRCYTHSPYQFLKTWGVWHTLEHSPLALYFRLFKKDNPFKPFSPQNYNFELVKCQLFSVDLTSLIIGPSFLGTSFPSR